MINYLKNYKIAAVILPAIFLIGCAPATRFEWGNYENSLYAFSKNPTDTSAYKASLTAAIKRGEETNRVAPGLCAELGYIKLSEGDTQGALILFKKEIQYFPESEVFINKTIKSLETTSNPNS